MNFSARSRAPMPVVIAITTVLALTACGSSANDDRPAANETSPTTHSPEPAVVDWVDDDRPTTFRGAWTIRSVEGDAPILAVERNGRLVGAVEANAYPVSSMDAGGDLVAMARDLYATSRTDRRRGCGYEISTAPIDDATVGGRPGKTYGFSGPAGASPTERIISYATVSGEHVIIIVVSAHNADGCIRTEEVVFDTATLSEFEPLLARIVADTPLPLEALNLRDAPTDDGSAAADRRIVSAAHGIASSAA